MDSTLGRVSSSDLFRSASPAAILSWLSALLYYLLQEFAGVFQMSPHCLAGAGRVARLNRLVDGFMLFQYFGRNSRNKQLENQPPSQQVAK
jgi:hypothetical protein